MSFTVTVVAGFGTIPSIQQQREADCGPSCVGLVLRMLNHADAASTTPQSLRTASQTSSGRGYRPAITNVGLSAEDRARQGFAIAFAMARPGLFLGDGTYADNLAAMLREKFGYANANYQQGDVKSIIRKASTDKPFIVHVIWEGGGGHWIVACGFKKHYFGRSEFCFSDPYYGALALAIPTETGTGGSKQPAYRPLTARGHLSGWYINVL